MKFSGSKICPYCRREIPKESRYCLYCGKEQPKAKTIKIKAKKRPHGTGTISRDTRRNKSWVAHSPSRNGKRIYLGSYVSREEAQDALNNFIQNGCSDLHNATVADIYQLWSNAHFKQVSESTIKLYSSMWKRFAPISQMKIRDVRTTHFQEIVNTGTSKSACDTIKIIALMLCRYAMENDIILKNYAEFIRIPKFKKKEKQIFRPKEIATLWKHVSDKRVQIILFMIYTRLRIGEVASLQCSDIHLNDGYLVGGEKTEAGKNRIIPIPAGIPELSDFVSSWMQETKTKSLLNLTTAQIRNHFYHALSEYGIQDRNDRRLTPHSTRHTFASLSASAGIQPEHLQKIIGHANFSTTAETYIHQDTATLCSEMAKIKKTEITPKHAYKKPVQCEQESWNFRI